MGFFSMNLLEILEMKKLKLLTKQHGILLCLKILGACGKNVKFSREENVLWRRNHKHDYEVDYQADVE